MRIPALEGRLLVATPTLADGVFDRAVVLVLDHDEDGAMGVVLNEPSETSLESALPGWAGLGAEPDVVFVGGPVDPSVVVALGRSQDRDRDGLVAVGGPIDGGLAVVDVSRDLTDRVEAIRLFVGYAGWSPGQLEDEIEAGAWFVTDADPGDALAGDPAGLYRRVLRRAGGRLALYATYPADPRAN